MDPKFGKTKCYLALLLMHFRCNVVLTQWSLDFIYFIYFLLGWVGVGGLFFWSQCLDLGPHNEAPLQWIWHDELWFDTPTPPPTIHTHTIFLARLFFSDGWNWAEQNKLCVQSPISMKYYFFSCMFLGTPGVAVFGGADAMCGISRA